MVNPQLDTEQSMPADNPAIRGPRDASRIAMQEDYEVQYWTKKFGVSKAELQAAVDSVGHMAVDVQKKLGK